MGCGEVIFGLLVNSLIGGVAFLLVMFISLIEDETISDIGCIICKIFMAIIISVGVYSSFIWWGFIIDGGLHNTVSTDVEETEIVEDAEKDDVILLNNGLITPNEDGTYTFNNKKYKSSDNGYFFYLVDDDANANTDVDTGTIIDAEASIDIYYTKSYNTELFTDGTDYYLLVSVPNGDYPYKLNNAEYLDIITCDSPASYIVVMSVNGTPNTLVDDTILTLYPVAGKG